MSGPARCRHVFAALALILSLGACGSTRQTQTGSSSSPQPAVPAGEGTTGGKDVDACSLVTQQDATALFGQPASPQQGSPSLDPNVIGECLWTWDTEGANQLLQFRIRNGARYYGGSSGTEPCDIGEKGCIRAHPVAGVDIEWVQQDKTISLSYSTIGKGVPKATSRVEELKTLARRISSQL